MFYHCSVDLLHRCWTVRFELGLVRLLSNDSQSLISERASIEKNQRETHATWNTLYTFLRKEKSASDHMHKIADLLAKLVFEETHSKRHARSVATFIESLFHFSTAFYEQLSVGGPLLCVAQGGVENKNLHLQSQKTVGANVFSTPPCGSKNKVHSVGYTATQKFRTAVQPGPLEDKDEGL